ncbi:MAG: two-component regulator propeller domain-containing protein [Ginsengibacter sp.]
MTIFCTLLCAAGSLANAQKAGGIFHHLTTKNGLSSNRVNKIIQDGEGFYWIATDDGLNRFDGSNCKIFRSIKNDPASLSSNNCLNLLEDDNGDIWIATPRGVNRYITKEGRFERYYLSHPTLSLAQVNAISGMVKDEVGNIWIASAGLWQYNIYSRKWTRYLNKPNDKTSIPAGTYPSLQYDKFNKGLWMCNQGFVFFEINASKFHDAQNNPKNLSIFKITPADPFCAIDSAGAIWFYKYPGGELCKYFMNNNTIRFFSVKNNSGSIRHISVDSQNRLWFSYWNSSTRIFDPVTNKTDTSFLAYFHQQSPLTANAFRLYIDRKGIYWISSAEGVSIYDPNEQAVKYFFLNDNRKKEKGSVNAITCLAEQNENTLWVGTRAALFHYDLLQEKARAIENLPLNSKHIRCLYLQKDSVLWIGGWDELLLFDLRSEKTLKKISLHDNHNPQFIAAGSKGEIWVGTWSKGLFKFSPGGVLLDHIMREPGNSGSLRYNGLTCFSNSMKEPCFWIGYNYENGFFKLNYVTHAIKNFKIPTPSPFASVSNSINSIAEDSRGNLWLGTHGGGLVYFDRRKNSFITYTESDGLKGDYINNILQDAHSNTWVTTSNGLSIIDARTSSIINSEIDLSFENNDLVTNGIIRKNKNLLFFSGLKMVEIDPVAFLQPAHPSKILLSNFKIFEKETAITKNTEGKQSINLSYEQNFFSFGYSLLKANPETATQYAYKLDEFDDDWNTVRERKTAYYTNVPPGNYVFRVKATDASGQWIYFSDPVAISVSPPFWKTWWFYLVSGAALIALVIYIVRSREKQFRERQQKQLRLVVNTQEQEKKHISAELHDDLGVRLSALKYFVTSLKDHLQTGNQLAADAYTRSMKVIDESVDDIRYMLVNLSPKTLHEYGYLTAVEDLVTKLSRLHIIVINLHQEGMEQRLPADMETGLYRVTQELINNTLKHAGAKAIDLTIEKTADLIKFKYADDGKGFNLSQNGNGYGIENIHARVAMMNGKIEWNTTGGMKVTIIIPLNHP